MSFDKRKSAFFLCFLRSGRHNILQFTNLFHKNNDIMQIARLCRLSEQEPYFSSIPQTAFIQRKAEKSYKVTKSREQNKKKALFFCRDGVSSPS